MRFTNITVILALGLTALAAPVPDKVFERAPLPLPTAV
jgi:hypothetical protein